MNFFISEKEKKCFVLKIYSFCAYSKSAICICDVSLASIKMKFGQMLVQLMEDMTYLTCFLALL